MSLTRRKWFLHRVVPASAVMAASTSSLTGVAAAAAPSGNVTLDRKARIHPLLQYGAQKEPGKRISVIVQKKTKSASSAEIARAGGGQVQEEFGFINGFVMEIPQKAVEALAKNPNVGYVTPNAKLRFQSINTSNLKTTHLQTIGVPSIWNGTSPATGKGVTIAVLDSGVNTAHPDLAGVEAVLVNPRATGRKDQNGHGTHVIGTIKGRDSLGRYLGVAPDANVISLQIADDTGASREADLIRGLQWVNQNRAARNIRVVNLSVNGTLPCNYLTSPICAAVETLQNRGVVVVVASGNRGSAADAVHYAPACDPFVISVGSLDDNNTTGTSDDSLASYSSRGLTLSGHAKPEIVAPGRKVVAPLASPSATLAKQFPDRIADSSYIRLSGTSMASPVVAGVVALILERFPSLNANQVKWLLMNTGKGYAGQVGSAGVVNPAAALQRAAAGGVLEANQGVPYNTTVAAGMEAVQGTAAYWDAAYWDAAYWDAAYWDAAYWDAAYWDAAYWDAAAWEAVEYDLFTGD